MNLTDNIASIKDDELLIIPCEDNNTRKIIHSYIENYNKDKKDKNKLGHIGLHIDRFKNKVDVVRRCYCGNKCKLEYHNGFMDNNKDEYYSGYCGYCDEFINWECNYDDSDYIFRIYHNNVICIGKSIQVSKPFMSESINYDEINDINIDEAFKIKAIDNWILRGSQGRKGKLNKKKRILVDYILSINPQNYIRPIGSCTKKAIRK